jgi:hypothetical protein
MNIVRILISKLQEIEPNLNWIAFSLKGGGLSSGNFEAIEACINNNQIIKRELISGIKPSKLESDAENARTLFNKSDELISFNEFKLLDEILPNGVTFFAHWGARLISANSGWSRISKEVYAPWSCDGVLFFKCKTERESITVNIKPSNQSKSYTFKTKKDFKGCLLTLENSEDALGKDFQYNALPIVFPGIYLEEIKTALPDFESASADVEITDQGTEKLELNHATLRLSTSNMPQKPALIVIENIVNKNKTQIVNDLLREEGLKFYKGQRFKISGVISFINAQSINNELTQNATSAECDLEAKSNSSKGFSGITFKYRLQETFEKEVQLSELQIEEIADLLSGNATLKINCPLNEEVGRLLSLFDGPLYLPVNCEISNVFAQTIIKHNGKGIYFVEETSCDDDSEGPRLSNQTAEILSRYKGDLAFDFLPKLNYGDAGDEICIAKVFGEHKGGSLSLLNLKKLSPEAAVLLSKHEEPVEMDSISDEKILKTFEEAQRRWNRL